MRGKGEFPPANLGGGKGGHVFLPTNLDIVTKFVLYVNSL